MKLFYAPGTCALASHIALEEAGAAFAAVRVDFGKNEQRQPEYLRINPKGRVPALVTDRGILTENVAILAFAAHHYPAAKLAPLDDPFAFAQVQAFNSYLASTVHVAHAHGRRGYRWADNQSSFDDMKRKLPETMGACFELIEHEMFKGPWVMGEAYTICDPYLFTIAEWARKRRRRPDALSQGARPPPPDVRAPRRQARADRRGQGLATLAVFAVMARLGLAIHEFQWARLGIRGQTRGCQCQALA